VGGRLEPLSRRPFGRLLGSYTINELGDSVGVIALALLVYEETGKATATAALFIAAKFVPAFIAPGLTARLDQLDLRRTLGALYVAEALVFGLLAFVADGRYVLPVVLVLGLIDGTLAVTARALTRGAVGTLLQPVGLLKEANGLLNIGFAAASVGGAALAGLLISQWSISVALAADAASFMIIAVVLSRTAGLPAAQLTRERWKERFQGGLSFARSSPVVRMLLVGEGLALIFFTLVVPIEVIYVRDSLDSTSAGFGLLVAAWGVGIVLGSLLYLVVKSRSASTLIIASTAAIGVAYCGMSVATTLAVACLLAVLGGTGNGIQWIAVVTGLQEATPIDLQARVVGLLESLNAALPGVGFLIGGVIAALASPRTAYAVAGIGVLVLVVLALIFRHLVPEVSRGPGAASRRDPTDDVVLPAPTGRVPEPFVAPPHPSA
jgi:MFS family permease